jgi:helicase MOV-10
VSYVLFIIRNLSQNECRIVGLQRNRRSHGAIIAWPNRYFYEDIMRAHGNRYVTDFLLHSRTLPKRGFPVLFHGIKGTEKRTKRSPSYFNIIEASVVRNYCVMLIEDTERKICKCGTSLGFAVILLTLA